MYHEETKLYIQEQLSKLLGKLILQRLSDHIPPAGDMSKAFKTLNHGRLIRQHTLEIL